MSPETPERDIHDSSHPRQPPKRSAVESCSMMAITRWVNEYVWSCRLFSLLARMESSSRRCFVGRLKCTVRKTTCDEERSKKNHLKSLLRLRSLDSPACNPTYKPVQRMSDDDACPASKMMRCSKGDVQVVKGLRPVEIQTTYV